MYGVSKLTVLTKVEDHEQSSTLYYDSFAATLKNLYSTSSCKDYYLSVAPSCANTTASLIYPASFYSHVDYIWPRFYNARACNTASTGFNASVVAWDRQINNQVGSYSVYPRLYFSAVSFNTGHVNNGYLAPSNLSAIVTGITSNVSDRFGGVTLWDGTYGLTNTEDGESYIDIVKSALTEHNVSHATNLDWGSFWDMATGNFPAFRMFRP